MIVIYILQSMYNVRIFYNICIINTICIVNSIHIFNTIHITNSFLICITNIIVYSIYYIIQCIVYISIIRFFPIVIIYYYKIQEFIIELIGLSLHNNFNMDMESIENQQYEQNKFQNFCNFYQLGQQKLYLVNKVMYTRD